MEHPFDVLGSPVRRRIVDLLAQAGGQEKALDDGASGTTAVELGQALGLHPTTVRFHLDQLAAAGLVESLFERRGVGRPRKIYRTPHPPLPVLDRLGPMAELTALLTEAFDRIDGGEPVTPEEAGRRWAMRHAEDGGATSGAIDGQGTRSRPAPARTAGQWLGKVGLTLDLLHRWGYSPEVRTADGGRTAELTLVDCPFLELARTHPGVVCGVHRGLLRGALETVGEPHAEVGLQPLVAPGRCQATVTTRTSFT